MNGAIIFIMLASLAAGAADLSPERKDFAEIRALERQKKNEPLLARGVSYLKKYPSGRNRTEVLTLMARIDPSPDRVLAHCAEILAGNALPAAKEKAAEQRCDILFLKARWAELDREAGRWKSTARSRSVREKMLLYDAVASSHKGDQDGAAKSCRALMDSNHDYDVLARAGLILSHIMKTASGYTTRYINTQSELLMSFGYSEYAPTVLMNAGAYYERKGDHDRAYSAYHDCAGKYPRSPEAIEARRKIEKLAPKKPRLIAQYLPTQKIVADRDEIDIRPEYDVDDTERYVTYFSVSVGPFPTLKEMKEVRRLVAEDHPSIISIRRRSGFTLYIGRERNSDGALGVKIRLAEEYGINGQIVRVKSSNKRKYIYGD